MTQKDKTKAEAIAKMHGLKLDFCEIPATGLYGTLGAIIVWRGIGDASYIQIRELPRATGKAVVIPLGKEIDNYPVERAKAICGTAP